MYDLRNHGHSDLGTCPWISWGPEEAKDVVAAVEFISNHDELRNANVGLLSICMGAAASAYAYGMGSDGLQAFSNIKAMIAVQPLHYREFVKAFGIPGFLDRAGTKVSNQRLGFDIATRTFMSDVKHITVPTMVMQNENDPWTDLDFVKRFYDELRVDKELRMLDPVQGSRGRLRPPGHSPTGARGLLRQVSVIPQSCLRRKFTVGKRSR